MTENIIKKSDVTKTLRKAMLPIGIITAIAGFVYLFLYSFALTTSGDDVEKIIQDLLNGARYTAIAFAFLALVLAGLMIAHAILQLVKLNKANLKSELVSGIINAVAGLLMFIFFILVVTEVFTESKWYGQDSYKNTTFMGLLTALSIYLTSFANTFNKPSIEGKNTNIKMLRSIAVFTLAMSLCGILATVFTAAGGFIDIEKVTEAGKAQDWLASSFTAKFAIAGFGVIALGLLCMIPLGILGISNKEEVKKHIITWSIIGGIMFILFVIAGAMMSLDQGAPKTWIVDFKNVTITVFVLINCVMSIVAGAFAFAKTKQFAPKVAKA